MTDTDSELIYRAHYPDGSTRIITQAEADALRSSQYGHRVVVEPVRAADFKPKKSY